MVLDELVTLADVQTILSIDDVDMLAMASNAVADWVDSHKR